MSRFSARYNLQLTQPTLDFVDIRLSHDTALFIDPYAISSRNDGWSALCNAHLSSFFTRIIDCIQREDIEQAEFLLNGLSEPNETHLGLSRARPQGRGVSGKQARDLYAALARSRAAHTGILTELSECDLFVPGIGPDKISDITTNVIRGLLIKYTQDQCDLHGIQLEGSVASGRIWNIDEGRWMQQYVRLPVVDGQRIILVPKFIARYNMSIDYDEYYNHYVLNFLQSEHLGAHSSLVRALKNGNFVVTEKDLKKQHPKTKDWLAMFSENHPEILERYKTYKKTMIASRDKQAEAVMNEDDFDEASFALSLREHLACILPGKESAHAFHKLIVGIIEFLFWPDLIYPREEHPIYEGRKRIDVTYTNASYDGFFFRLSHNRKIPCGKIIIECENYWDDPENPEVDQLAGRFSVNLGRFGFLICRNVDKPELLRKRCRDTCLANNGFIIVLDNSQIDEFLIMIQGKSGST
jgi:hypothetical protein